MKGPKGQMKQALPPGITAAIEDGTLVTKKISDDQSSTSSTAWRAAW